jgi:hypothetical protein
MITNTLRQQNLKKIFLHLVVVAGVILSGCGGGGSGSESPSPSNNTSLFDELWESATLGSYSPADDIPLINADEGDWIIGDTVSEFSDCGVTPHTAEIISSDGGKALQLTSNDSMSTCSDNVWVVIAEVPQVNLNSGFSVPLSVNTIISFEETGSLNNPQSGSNLCIVKPCGDTISLMLTDNNGNVLAYILQRANDAQPDTSLNQYREIFLDTTAGAYSRDLHADFKSIPNYQPKGAFITSIEFKIQEHGTATLDNLVIKEVEAPDNSGKPVQVTEEDLFGIWRRLDPSHTHKGKEYLADGSGWLGNFNSGPFTRATQLTWSLDGVTLTDVRVDGVRVEDIVYFDGNKMTTQRVDNGKYLNWEKQ